MAGDGNARIPEIIIFKLGKVSPAARQLYLYYCARRNAQSGGWKCPIPKAAGELEMSDNRCFEARKELREKGWIELSEDDFTRPLFGYTVFALRWDEARKMWVAGQLESSSPEVENSSSEVENSTSQLESSSAQVENSSPEVENSSSEVENSTSGISKDRARDLTTHLPLTLPSPLPPQTHPHTAASAPEGSPPAAGVGVCSAFTFEERKRYAANNRDKSGELLGSGWLKESRNGSFDELIADWYAKQARGASPVGQPQRDASNCPDCNGTGFWYPGGRGNGAAKCQHPRLTDSGDPSPPEPALVAARSP